MREGLDFTGPDQGETPAQAQSLWAWGWIGSIHGRCPLFVFSSLCHINSLLPGADPRTSLKLSAEILRIRRLNSEIREPLHPKVKRAVIYTRAWKEGSKWFIISFKTKFFLFFLLTSPAPEKNIPLNISQQLNTQPCSPACTQLWLISLFTHPFFIVNKEKSIRAAFTKQS